MQLLPRRTCELIKNVTLARSALPNADSIRHRYKTRRSIYCIQRVVRYAEPVVMFTMVATARKARSQARPIRSLHPAAAAASPPSASPSLLPRTCHLPRRARTCLTTDGTANCDSFTEIARDQVSIDVVDRPRDAKIR